jgi:succinoglycan biosynthesis transport protein ExoP
MSFNQFISILKARKLIFLAVILTIVLTALIVSLVLPKQYTGTAAVVVDVKSPDPIAGVVMQGVMLPSYMATQVNVIESERVALKVIRKINMATNETIREQWTQDTGGLGNIEAWLAKRIKKSLEVKPDRDSNVINISYTAVDPDFAAAMTNAFVQAYIDTTIELRVEPARQYMALFEEQTRQLRDRLEKAQTRLSEYQRSKGILATDERLDIETNRLSELSTQLVALQAVSADSASRKAQAGANSVEVLSNPVVSSLKSDLARQESKLKELAARYGSSHPLVAEAMANIIELRTKIDAETARVTSSLGVSNTVNQSREAQVKAALEQQRQQVLKMKEQRDEAAVMVRDVENSQRAYDSMQARLQQTSLESQSNQGNVSILKVASRPDDPTSPKVFLNIAVALVLGTFFALGLTLAIELLNRRIRTSEDVSLTLGVPVLSSMPKLDLSSDRKSKSSVPRLATRKVPSLGAPNRS